MAVASAPNQTRLKILASVLHLERFTVAELCLRSGLEPSMVYRELSALQQQGILSSKSAIGVNETAPRHRPSKVYELSSDSGLRAQLEEELGSFLPNFEELKPNRHLKRAQDVLNLLSVELLNASLDSVIESQLNTWEKNRRDQLEQADKELTRAAWESETDFSEAGASDHPIIIARRLYDSLESRFRQQLHQERVRRESEMMRARWGVILTSALRAAVPAISREHIVPAFLSNEFVDLPQFSGKVAKLVKKTIEANLDLRAKQLELRPFVTSLQLDLTEAQSPHELGAALAKHCIAYGNSVKEPLAFIRELVSESEDFRLRFNEANLAQLAGRSAEAFDSWTRYLAERPTVLDIKCVQEPLVARVAAERWSAETYREAVRIITLECNASVSAISETPFENDEGYEIEPQLYNPLPDKLGRESAFIPIAEPLAENRRLYVTTTEAEHPIVLGLPAVARAGLFQTRLKDEDAWDLAGKIQPTERIVKVEFFRNASPDARHRAERILTSELSAELVGH